MKRVASIHITEEVLIKILDQGDFNIKANSDNGKYYEYAEVARFIVEKAKTYSCSSRAITVSNDKLLKKTEKMKLSSRSNTGMFAQILLLVRRKFKHRGIQLITPSDKEWLDLKAPCNLATEFSNEFQLPQKQGYTLYLETAMGMMAKYSIYKLKSIHAAICNRYEATQEIASDKTPERTEAIHRDYLARISEKIGYSQDYKTIPEKYVFFVRAKKEADTLGISYKQYIRAQFSALEWTNGIPDPTQLAGVKARERVQKYAYENDVQLKREGTKGSQINFKKIKDARKNRNRK